MQPQSDGGDRAITKDKTTQVGTEQPAWVPPVALALPPVQPSLLVGGPGAPVLDTSVLDGGGLALGYPSAWSALATGNLSIKTNHWTAKVTSLLYLECHSLESRAMSFSAILLPA